MNRCNVQCTDTHIATPTYIDIVTSGTDVKPGIIVDIGPNQKHGSDNAHFTEEILFYFNK